MNQDQDQTLFAFGLELAKDRNDFLIGRIEAILALKL